MKNVYKHIDDGGVLSYFVDGDPDAGILFVMCAQYHGHPSIETKIRVDELGHEWFIQMGQMFFEMGEKIKNKEK